MRHKGFKSVLAISLISTFVLSGCGIVTPSSIDPPPNSVNVTKQGDVLKTTAQPNASQSSQAKSSLKTQKTSATMKEVLYLMDSQGRVAPQVVSLPKTKSVAKEALQYLVKDGPVSNILPNGFQAVLPAGTQVNGVNIKPDGTMVVDFSKDIENYKANDEEKLLQSITWTMTQFNNVKRVQLRINGVDQSVMPVAKTPIGNGLTRAMGINNMPGNVVDVASSNSVTLYYLAQHNNNFYYVPVTERINASQGDIKAVIDQLIQGPSFDSGLTTAFSSDVSLVSDPVVKNGVVTLNFNKQLFMDQKSHVISNKALDAIVLSLTSQPGIKAVSIEVNGDKKVMAQSGKQITKPVSKPIGQNVAGI